MVWIWVVITEGSDMYTGSGLVITVALLGSTGTGIYLFAIGSNRQLTQLGQIRTENKILKAKLEQAKLQKELSAK